MATKFIGPATGLIEKEKMIQEQGAMPQGLTVKDPAPIPMPTGQAGAPPAQGAPVPLPSGGTQEPSPGEPQPIPMPQGLTQLDEGQEPEPDYENMEWSNVLMSGLKSVPGSGYQYLKDMVNMVVHPIESAKAVGGLAAGAAQKLIPGEQEQEANFDLMVDYYTDRYGSMAGFKKALAKDPVGVLADGATFVTPGGAAIKGAGTASKLKFLQQAGAKIQKGGSMMEPITAASKLSTKAAGHLPLIGKLKNPEDAYQSAVKFSTTLDEAERSALSKTALAEKIMPNVAGLDKLRAGINVLAKDIDDLITRKVDTGQKIPVEALVKHIDKLRQEAAQGGAPKKDLKIIDGVVDDLLDPLLEVGQDQLDPKHVQRIKQDIYSKLKAHYDSRTNDPVKVEAQKAIAKGAKEALEEIIHEIKSMNQREGALISLKHALDRPVSRIKNRDIVGIGMASKIGSGSLIGMASEMAGVPGAGVGAGMAYGVMAGILDDPIVKSRLAIALNRIHYRGGKISEGTKNLIETYNIPVSKDMAKTLGLTVAIPERMKPEEEE